MPCVYIILSETRGRIYIGSSRKDKPSSRLKEHNSGRVRSTKFARPWSLMHEEWFADYTSARKRELLLKSGFGRKWIKENLRRGG